jgi:hypothetical protein
MVARALGRSAFASATVKILLGMGRTSGAARRSASDGRATLRPPAANTWQAETSVGSAHRNRWELSMRSEVLAAAAMLAATSGVAGQSYTASERGEAARAVLDPAYETALARSAAPPEVSADATVLLYRPGVGFAVGTRGAGDVTCLVNRSRAHALEPHCFDREGSETILRIHLREAELRERGLDAEAIQADIDRGIRSGELRLPSRPAMSYMMSAEQVLISDDGRNVGAWKPHVMIYVPYITAEALGLGGEPSTRAAVVVDPGTALANIMIVVEEFVDPAEFAGDD